ncbi:class I SAM-dependent methyltransferase [Streptacidiphilus sp. EB129]|uniref:class I SAM-dependent methyltransferase n=1 Tax=Streptacidiphilus sp. EB129 TaxID=3156262 RepID=UPI003516F52A
MTSPDAIQQEPSTADESYTDRLLSLESSGLRRLIPAQAPYRAHLRRLKLGRMLDIGCGLGRNLLHNRGIGVGVDHNAHSVATARSRGLTAYTPEEFAASADAVPGSFDSLLISHVLEHIDKAGTESLLQDYLRYVRPGGRVVMITPQEAGFASDATHIRWVDFDVLRAIAADAGIDVRRTYSFPLPRLAGKLFRYNEFVCVSAKPEA